MRVCPKFMAVEFLSPRGRLRSATGRGKGTGSEAACFSPRRCLSPRFGTTPGTGTAEQHGGASPLRRCRPKARESIGMRIRRSGAATCKLPENICTPGNARKKVRKSLANHAVLLPRGAAGMIHPSGLRPPRGGPRAGAAQKRGREPHRTPFVPVIVRGRHLSEQADS